MPCPYASQETIPHLARSALHRPFQRHGSRRLPAPEPAEPKKKFKDYPIGYLHVDFAQGPTEEGRAYLFVAIDRTSKRAFAEWQPRATKMLAADFLRRVLAAIPYKVHKVLTGTGTDRHECPFCFVLTQFQASREQRAARTQDPHTPPGSYEARLQALDE